MKATPPVLFKSISEFMRILGMPKPLHPLVALVNYDHAKGNRECAKALERAEQGHIQGKIVLTVQ